MRRLRSSKFVVLLLLLGLWDAVPSGTNRWVVARAVQYATDADLVLLPAQGPLERIVIAWVVGADLEDLLRKTELGSLYVAGLRWQSLDEEEILFVHEEPLMRHRLYRVALTPEFLAGAPEWAENPAGREPAEWQESVDEMVALYLSRYPSGMIEPIPGLRARDEQA